MKTKFNSLEIEGFRSIVKPLTFNFKDRGLTVIKGKNGIGKTTLFNALFWVVNGKMLKGKSDPSPWKSVRTTRFRGTKVVLNFTIDNKQFQIIRCHEFKVKIDGYLGASRIIFKVDGETVKEKSKPTIQTLIYSYLRISPDLMKNSIIFGQKMKRLIEESGPKQKEVMEEAFEASYITRAKKKADDERNELGRLLRSTEDEIDSIKDRISDNRDNYKKLKNQQENFDKYKQDRIKELEVELKELKNELLKCREYTLLKKEVGKVRGKVIKLTDNLKKFKTEKCSKCGSDINLDKKVKLKDRITKQKVLLSDLVDEIQDLLKLKADIKLKKSYIKLEKEKRLSEIDLSLLKNKINKLKKKLKPLKQTYNKTKEELSLLDWIVQDPLSNTGLRAYLFNILMDEVNHQLSTFTPVLQFKVEFGIDMQSARKDFYSNIIKNNELIMYDELSGGQQQLVNICISLAIHEVVNKEHDFNILLMDEVFESLDEDNIEIVCDLVTMKSQTKDVYLVTHLSTFQPTNSQILHFDRDNKGSTIIV